MWPYKFHNTVTMQSIVYVVCNVILEQNWKFGNVNSSPLVYN